jgi:trigger factor
MRLQSQGISMTDYQNMMGMNKDAIRASARPNALHQVQLELALSAVAKAEGIEISDEELEDEYKRMAEQYKLDLERVKAAVPVEDLKHDLSLKKANDLVIGAAKVSKTKKKAAEDNGATAEEKPKRTRKKKTEGTEEPKAE